MTHQGSCHCGAVEFTVDATIDKVLACNCSICRRKGHLLAFVTENQFTLAKGADALSDYQFNKKTLHHRFCNQCGIGTFSHGSTPDGKPMYAINVRCLEDVDIEALPVDHYDGKSL